MRIVLLDGYIDEPSCLGVPPFISPYVRYTAGAILDLDHDITYMTIDEYRRGSPKIKKLAECDMLVVLGGAIVPGKYLRGTPASVNELGYIGKDFQGTSILGGPVATYGFSGDRRAEALKESYDFLTRLDVDAFVHDYLSGSSQKDRRRHEDEWRAWSCKGSSIVSQHPDHPVPLIAELESSRGCVRYFTGGCSFCTEPIFGEPLFRSEKDIVEEVEALQSQGVVNFRLGAQSCIFSYRAEGIGTTETPVPKPEIIERVLKGIRKAAPDLKVLHTDNANPAVIARHPEESEKIIRSIVKYCTSGNVLALGMESADPEVIAANNLNATPDQVMGAVVIINKYGAQRGENGMPRLLPGINLLSGLAGETAETFRHNYRFLKEVLDSGLLLRRINIRQVTGVRADFDVRRHHTRFIRFKRSVRESIDCNMLKNLVPRDTVIRNVYIEKTKGNVTFGRQIGTYPLLVGIPYKMETDRFADVIITDHGQRSVTGIEHPLNVNTASLLALSSIPFIGKKRAARIIRARPFHMEGEFTSCLDDKRIVQKVLRYIRF
jgi:radical SAM superfamily enzyme with C-terminal helix-hairpin-helix motif